MLYSQSKPIFSNEALNQRALSVLHGTSSKEIKPNIVTIANN